MAAAAALIRLITCERTSPPAGLPSAGSAANWSAAKVCTRACADSTSVLARLAHSAQTAAWCSQPGRHSSTLLSFLQRPQQVWKEALWCCQSVGPQMWHNIYFSAAVGASRQCTESDASSQWSSGSTGSCMLVMLTAACCNVHLPEYRESLADRFKAADSVCLPARHHHSPVSSSPSKTTSPLSSGKVMQSMWHCQSSSDAGTERRLCHAIMQVCAGQRWSFWLHPVAIMPSHRPAPISRTKQTEA